MINRPTKRFFVSTMVNRVSPSVHFYAHSFNVDLSKISPTGMFGMITKFDIKSFIAKNSLKKISPLEKVSAKEVSKETKNVDKKAHNTQVHSDDIFTQSSTSITLDPERLGYGKNVEISKKSIPHTYISNEVNATKFLELIQVEGIEIEEAIKNILFKALLKLNLQTSHIIHSSKDGKLHASSTDISHFKVGSKEIEGGIGKMFTSDSYHSYAIISNLTEGISNSKAILPKNSLFYISFSNPQSSVEPAKALKFDLMDSDYEHLEEDTFDVSSFVIRKKLTINMSYDAARLEEHLALQIMNLITNAIELEN